MKTPLIALVAALALPLAAVNAQAQTSAAKKPAATKTAPAKKATTAKKTTKKVPAKTAKAVEQATPVQTPTERLTDAEQAIARSIHTGTIQCELGANVTVTADDKNPGFFHVASGKQRYYMHPVESRTGAVRMEDSRAGALWLQLGNKSMLMNQKLGQRVADACTTPAQRAVAAQLETHPQPALFEAPKP